MEKSILLSIYGVRKTKKGDKVSLTLIGNDDNGNKVFYSALVKVDNSGKVKVTDGKTKDGFNVAILSVPYLENKKAPEGVTEADDEMPF